MSRLRGRAFRTSVLDSFESRTLSFCAILLLGFPAYANWKPGETEVFGRFDWVGRLRCPFLRDEMQPRAVRFPYLFCRDNFASKIGKSNKLMLMACKRSFLCP